MPERKKKRDRKSRGRGYVSSYSDSSSSDGMSTEETPPTISPDILSMIEEAISKTISKEMYDGGNPLGENLKDGRPHPLASAKVMVVVLDGKFNDNRSSWSKADFEKSIKTSTAGDGNQGIVSDCVFNLDGGTGRHSGAKIWENSGNRKVKLGVMVLPDDSYGEYKNERVLEGVSKGFLVRDPKKQKEAVEHSQSPSAEQALVGCGEERNGPTLNISGQLQLPADTHGADPQPLTNRQTPVISDSMNQTIPTWVQEWLNRPIPSPIDSVPEDVPHLEYTMHPVQLLWDRPAVEPSKRWNLHDQLELLYSSQTKIHSGDFPTMHLMPEHYDSLTTYPQGPYQRLFFNEQALFLMKMMRDLQITTIPKEVMQTRRNRGVRIQPLEPDDSDDEPPLKRILRNKYQLRFVNKVCEAYYTGEKIKADDGNLLNVALYDENNAKITSGPLSSASVEVVVLHGDFNDAGQDYWTSEEFSSYIVCPLSGNEPPAVGGDRVLVLVDGQASLGDAFFQKSSTYARTGKFKMGVMLASTPDERVQEGISEPFWVWNRKGGCTGCTVFQRWHRAIDAISFIWRLQSETHRTRSMRRPLLSRDTGDACLELPKEEQCMQDSLLDAWMSGVQGFGVQLPKAAVTKNVTLLDPRNKGTTYHKMLIKRDIHDVQNEEYLPFADVKENDNEDVAGEAHDGNSGKEKMEIVCENTVSLDFKQAKLSNFVPVIRSGDWSDIGGRDYMEDAHVCISDLAKHFGFNTVDDEIISFYGVFDGHGGKDAAQFVCDNLPRVIVEDADFPLELEKVVRRSFVQIDSQFAETCSHHHALSSGTTALTAMIFGRSLLVANAGDCRAVLSRRGIAIEMSKDHRTSCLSERKRVESLGGYVDDGYLNGQLVVTRALGDWHLEDMKKMGETGGPLSAEPELKMITLTKDDEFLIIGSNGIWDVFSNQNAVDFARRRLQEHNDLRLCSKEVVGEAIRRGSTDNLTVVMVSFHQEAPPQIKVNRTGRVKRSISAEGLHSLKMFLEGC